MPGQYRQGDVLLRPISGIPQTHDKPSLVLSENRRLILARGEVTGHSHSISELDGTLSIVDGQLYLHTDHGATLLHEEHGSIDIAPGDYEVVIQQEYSPTSVGRLNVRD